MNIKAFVNDVLKELGAGPLGIALNEDAAYVLDVLGPRWLASAVAPHLLLNRGKRCRFDLHMQSFEPMQNESGALKDPRVGTLIHGNGAERDSTEIILLPAKEILQGTAHFAFGRRGSFIGEAIAKTYTRLYRDVPLLLDSYRQWRASSSSGAPIRGMNFSETTLTSDQPSRPTMWVAMHWAEAGGAESWAWEQARIAKEAGFCLVLTFDRAAPQRELDRAYGLTDHVYLVGNSVAREQWPAFASALVAHHGITHLYIHHSALAYENLASLRLEYPWLHVGDSTHIEEYRGGGFVRSSIENSAFIDVHHVISPELERRMLDAGVPEEKILFRPLTGFTLQEGSTPKGKRKRTLPLTVGFMGRLSAQKRPYLFQRVALAMKLLRPRRVRFIMQGAGELASMVDADERKLRLSSLIERRPWGASADLLRDIDILLITSDNEGLTLTTLEADEAGVLVVSTDVGSQRSVIADEALLPRMPVPCLKAGVRLLSRLSSDEAFFDTLLDEQHRKVTQVRSLESASAYFASHYAQEQVK